MKEQSNFSPMVFLAALGAGGIAVAPFAFLQYVYKTGKGLVTLEWMNNQVLSAPENMLMYVLYAIMIVFATIHFSMMGIYMKKLFSWLGSDAHKSILNDPLKNPVMMTPFVAAAMSFNVVIGPTRFFVPIISDNLQALMLPALVALLVVWALAIKTNVKLLKIAFSSTFDISKINFGWLVQPFALAMITVTATGIAAMSKNSTVAHTAAFASLVSGSMALFLFLVKLFSIFKSHFAADSMPAKQFLPSLLIVVPILSLFGISGFRLGHYISHQFHVDMHLFSDAIIVLTFAFQTWYMIFGLTLLKDYLKNDFFKNEFYLSQWGLVCPFVGYTVIASFFYKAFAPNPLTLVIIGASLLSAISLYFIILRRQKACSGIRLKRNSECLNPTAAKA